MIDFFFIFVRNIERVSLLDRIRNIITMFNQNFINFLN